MNPVVFSITKGRSVSQPRPVVLRARIGAAALGCFRRASAAFGSHVTLDSLFPLRANVITTTVFFNIKCGATVQLSKTYCKNNSGVRVSRHAPRKYGERCSSGLGASPRR
ncbi:unnamed protein product [Parnassius mnemosyne]|uniref:Uncharacterized protein n=1 Tax=Parnassius mnemosyne TaxID=213953 RepID=A0AAV1KLF9_9NEOP